MVFDEPEAPSEGPFTDLVSWLRTAGGKAQGARQVINEWYSTFPDKEGMVLSRLHGRDDNALIQAVDELHVYHLLSQHSEPVYEEDENSPDFRLYNSSACMAGVEVATLFASEDFGSEHSRNSELTTAINARVHSRLWYLHFRVIRWARKPSERRLAEWIQRLIDDLPAPTPETDPDQYPTATYSTDDVDLEFSFIPRSPAPSSPGLIKSVVALGPMIMLWGKSDRRLRRVVSDKAGGRYDHRAAPFAVVVSIRDPLCDGEDIIDALYGAETVSIVIDNPGSAQATRKMNGVFARSPANPEGRNRRLSCVFTIKPGWWPDGESNTTLLRFDNPFAERPFPRNILVPDRHFMAQQEPNGVRMEWRT